MQNDSSGRQNCDARFGGRGTSRWQKTLDFLRAPHSVWGVALRASLIYIGLSAVLMAALSLVFPGVSPLELMAALLVYAVLIPPWILTLCGMAAAIHGLYGHRRDPKRAVFYGMLLAALLGVWSAYLLYREGIRPATLIYTAAAVTLVPLATAAVALQWKKFPLAARQRATDGAR